MDSRLFLMVMATDAMEAGLENLLGWWRRAGRSGRAAQQLRNLEAAGWIGRPQAGPVDGRLYHLTDQGARLLAGGVDPEARWARPWDGRWRMVFFDVPQAQAKLRTELRRKLRAQRFGWLQDSVWLSPDPVTEFGTVDRPRLAVESLVVMEGRPVGGESDAELVAGAWDFSRLAKLHASYSKLLRLRPVAGRETKLVEWSTWIATELRAWQEILAVDPFLPAPLLPAGYAGQAVWRARREAMTAVGQAVARVMVRT
jgi:phenylacetic acid degradation operon negative regulatory protein